MPAPLTPGVQQLQQAWTAQLAPHTLLTVGQDISDEWRERCLEPVTTLEVFFVQVVHGHTACTPLRHLTKLDRTASASCPARPRLPLEGCHRRLRAVGDAVQHAPLAEGRWLGHRPLWADGSSFSRPDPPKLQEHGGHPGGQPPGCGWPVAHLMALLPAGTGMVRKRLRAPWRTHDRSQAVPLQPALPAGDVLVADRGLCS